MFIGFKAVQLPDCSWHVLMVQGDVCRHTHQNIPCKWVVFHCGNVARMWVKVVCDNSGLVKNWSYIFIYIYIYI
jgi:hypothetical protein